MADVRPFHGLRFNTAVTGPLGPALCPPYDIISPAERQRLLAASPYNAVRIELSANGERAAAAEEYATAARTLALWRKDGALVREGVPAYYVIRHEFVYQGRAMARMELTAAVRLEPLGKGSIKPHEDTRKGPKEDRFKLMAATHTNISPVMLLYAQSKSVGDALAEAQRAAPPLAADLGGGERLLAWPVTDAGATRKIQESLAGESLYIADGHHRYETALAYRDESPRAAGDAANFVMASLIAFDDPGLLSLPYHRMLKGLDEAAMRRLRAQMEKAFTPVRHNMSWCPPVEVAEAALASLGAADVVFEVWGLEAAQRTSLRLRNPETVGMIAGGNRLRAWASLSTTLFREALLRPALGLHEEEAEHRGLLAFSKDAADAVHQVNTGAFQLAFLPHAVPMEALREVSDRGERLPPKSTYFHPKLPTGLVLHPLEGAL
ncbi:MAG: DUF1015 domain-containing protein [Dehalococcoidia bacterium]|nr:DUF1015 domain-containing protein [Dehalococcoidia bacterium]